MKGIVKTTIALNQELPEIINIPVGASCFNSVQRESCVLFYDR